MGHDFLKKLEVKIKPRRNKKRVQPPKALEVTDVLAKKYDEQMNIHFPLYMAAA
jgi:hypothetical protein